MNLIIRTPLNFQKGLDNRGSTVLWEIKLLDFPPKNYFCRDPQKYEHYYPQKVSMCVTYHTGDPNIDLEYQTKIEIEEEEEEVEMEKDKTPTVQGVTEEVDETGSGKKVDSKETATDYGIISGGAIVAVLVLLGVGAIIAIIVYRKRRYALVHAPDGQLLYNRTRAP